MAQKPTTVTIDGTKYDIASLSKEVRATLASLDAIAQEQRRLRLQAEIARIAQQALARQLKTQLASQAA